MPPLRIPTWLRLLGLLAVVPSAILAARLVWEQTVLTWRVGSVMIGWSWGHGPEVVFFLSPVGLLLWIVVLVVTVVVGAISRRKLARSVWFDLAVAGVIAGLLLVPYQTWQWLFASRVAKSPGVGYVMVTAGFSGNQRLIEALVANGVAIDIRDRSGSTALHTAAAGNHVELLDYLLKRGLPIDAVDRSGDSALERAHAAGAQEAVAFLTARGGHRITGTEEQRWTAAVAIAREASEMQVRPSSPVAPLQAGVPPPTPPADRWKALVDIRLASPLPASEMDALRAAIATRYEGMSGDGAVVRHTPDTSAIEGTALLDTMLHCSTCPQVPFGFALKDWTEFKSRILAGDRLIYFRNNNARWQVHGGVEGFAIIRGSQVVATFVIRQN